MLKQIKSLTDKSFFLLSVIALLFACTNDNPDPTGLFDAEFTGDFQETLEGSATFELEPRGSNGVVIVYMRESNDVFIRLTFPNASPNEIFIEPGTYTVVAQLGNDLTSEVLVDYIDGDLSFTASSGEVNIGISKPTQLAGTIASAEFQILRSMCNGTFNAIPQ
jgi:hypothetical protein